MIDHNGSYRDVIAAQSVSSRSTYSVSMKLFVSKTMDEHEAASGASVTASAANVDMDALADFFHWTELRKTEMFQGLFREVRDAVKTNMERQCLSHHTLCGLEKAIPSPSGLVTRISGRVCARPCIALISQ